MSILAILVGSSWASGINLYLVIVGLGIAHRFEWLTLPGHLETISHPLIIFLALILYVIEFIADKVPYVDSAWDSVHTFIRPLGAAALVYFGLSEADPLAQTALSLAGGTLALDSHLMKAGTRAAINTSPEPFSNSVASVAEDTTVIGTIWLIINHPWVVFIIVALAVGLSIWLIPKVFRFFKTLFGKLFGSKQNPPESPNPT